MKGGESFSAEIIALLLLEGFFRTGDIFWGDTMIFQVEDLRVEPEEN